MGMYTALGESLAKYKPEQVMETIRIHWGMCSYPASLSNTSNMVII